MGKTDPNFDNNSELWS